MTPPTYTNALQSMVEDAEAQTKEYAKKATGDGDLLEEIEDIAHHVAKGTTGQNNAHVVAHNYEAISECEVGMRWHEIEDLSDAMHEAIYCFLLHHLKEKFIPQHRSPKP